MTEGAVPLSAATSIRAALGDIERAHDVRVLHACESGSRAWGFASPDSDFDARFIYTHPLEWYLSVEERHRPGEPQRDVIEQMLPGDLDVSGWDLRKTLRLVRKGNATAAEWLRSPLVYAGDPAARAVLREITDASYRPMAAWHHYRSMAQRNANEYLGGTEVRLKKYFYVLRPLLCSLWLECDGTPPPMEFAMLIETLLPRGSLRKAVDALLARKRETSELGTGPAIARIEAFIADELSRPPPELAHDDIDAAAIDACFRRLIGFRG